MDFQLMEPQELDMAYSAHLHVWKWKWNSLSPVRLCDPMDYTVHGILQSRILEWVAFPFSRGSSQPRDRTQVSHNAGGFFTSWATGEAASACLPLHKCHCICIMLQQLQSLNMR